MNHSFTIHPSEAAMLFDELYMVKEKDFSKQYQHLGSNKTKLLHLINLPTNHWQEATDIAFIKTVTEKGLKINPDDTVILNLQTCPTDGLMDLLNFFEPMYILFWGCTDWLNNQQINVGLYQIHLIKGVNCLFANDANTIASDAKLKAKLWGQLQKLFFN